MASVAWKRLVRYISSEGGVVRYGEPMLDDPHLDIGTLQHPGQLKVQVYEGSDLFSLRRSDKTETVHKLLGPLNFREVPIVRCIGLNYKSHILETGRPLPEVPTVFYKPSPTIADHEEDIPIPAIARDQCDYEGELVIVIGRDGKDISESEALDYIAGYTVGNDISSRDWQREPSKAGPVPQWSFSKSFDKYAPLGPCLVSTSELGAADSLSLRTFVNGQLRQETNTSDLWHGVRKLVAFCSQGQTLQRGSVIMTGTPGGVGLFMKPPMFLKDGDEVRVEIEGIGSLRNMMKNG